MKIGIMCEDEARFRQIIEALKKAEFSRPSCCSDAPALDFVLIDQEHAEDLDSAGEHREPCTFTRRPNGDLDVQCGRQREMMRRALRGIASKKSLTIVFQDNSEPVAAPALPAVAGQTCQC